MKRWLLLLLLVPTVLGHAVPYDSEPETGSRLKVSPTEVVVYFTEPVYEEGTWIRVFNADGDRVDNDDLHIQFGSQPILTVTVPPLPDAPYRIQWQTYSQTDGHTVGGSIGFALGSFAPPSTEFADESAANSLAVAARMVQYLSYALGAGALLAAYLGWAGPTRNALLVSAGGNVIGHAMLLLQTAQATGLGMAYLSSEGGLDILLRTIGWGLFAVLVLRPRFFLVLLGWLLLALYDARFGHASQTGAWAIAVEFVHLVAVSLWVGGLAWFVKYGTKEQGPQFGRVAVWAVIAMALSGFALTVGVLGSNWSLQSLWSKLLLAKVLLVLGMLALAYVNRFVILGKPEDPGKWLRNRINVDQWSLRRVAGTEAVLGVVTLLVAGGLLSVGAPGATLEPAFSEDLQGFDISGTIRITPEPVAGAEHTVRVFLVESDTNDPIVNNTCGKSAGCVKLSWFSDADGELTAQDIELESQGDGWWEGKMTFFSAGTHTVRVDAATAWLQDQLVGSVPVS